MITFASVRPSPATWCEGAPVAATGAASIAIGAPNEIGIASPPDVSATAPPSAPKSIERPARGSALPGPEPLLVSSVMASSYHGHDTPRGYMVAP